MSQPEQDNPRRQSASPGDMKLDGIWNRFPSALHPYIRLARFDRPIGWWLLLLPGWWILAAFSADLSRGLWLMGLFAFGAIVMRGAGCIINDLWDRNIDKKIARTRNRPLASNQITPFQASMFICLLFLIGFIILIQLPVRSWIIGLAALPLIIIYPLAKRIINWPQLILGLTFSWGVPVAVSVLWNTPPPYGIYLIYAGTVFWVIGYDTIYAVQDKADDQITGVKSSALALGRHLKAGVAICYICALGLWGYGFYSLLDSGIWLAGLALAGLHLCWQITKLTDNNPALAERLFTSNRNAGLLITAGFLAQKIISAIAN